MSVIRYPGGGGTTPAPIVSGVDQRHVDWLRFQNQWSRIRDVLDGTDAVRSNAYSYIPQTEENKQFPGTFESMVARTSFTNFAARAVDGLEGLIFRKDPVVDVPYRYKPRLENINNAGDSVNTFSKKLTREVLCYGRVGILVDQLPLDEQRFQSPISLLPYLTIYGAQSITNWRPKNVNGEIRADQIVLEEPYDEPQEFGSVSRVRYRVLELDEENNYRIRIYEQGRDGGEFALVYEFYPTTGRTDGRKYFNRIPFVFVNPVDLGMMVRKSPILDLVDANLSHFLLESEYSTALFFSAQPTPVITGWKEDLPGTFRYGGGNMWLLPEGCTANILEFRGHGLGPLENAISAKERQIAELGARLVQNASSGPETAEAARIRQHSQTSVVGSIARTVSDGLRAALEIACEWAMADGKVACELNQDYLDATIAPQMISELIRAHQAGLMSKRDVVLNLLKGELLDPTKTVDQHVGELEEETPNLVGLPHSLSAFQRRGSVGPDDVEDDE